MWRSLTGAKILFIFDKAYIVVSMNNARKVGMPFLKTKHNQNMSHMIHMKKLTNFTIIRT